MTRKKLELQKFQEATAITKQSNSDRLKIFRSGKLIGRLISKISLELNRFV